jgi:hypothetical protein
VGQQIEKQYFSEREREAFRERLHVGLEALRQLLERPGFGAGPASIGAELEASIVDARGRALPVNEAVLARCADPRTQLELVAFNLEFNLTPVAAAGRPFGALERELDTALELFDAACAAEGGQIAPIGIVPTLRPSDLAAERITPQTRYRALVHEVERLQATPLHIDIHGEDDALQLESDTLAIQGSNTSFQVHLRVEPERYADTYNAAQLATPLALALGANAPILMGKLLWDETRVPLFKQALSGRRMPDGEWRPVVRVPFGHGWVRRGIHELFAESVALFPPVVASVTDEDPLERVRSGEVPELAELRLHQGTIWQWNRAVYDPGGGGHVRVELRALPSGPTPVDMAANAAFLLGLVMSLRDEMARFIPALPFRYAEHNFYRAAQHGLDARLLWPTGRAPSPGERPVVELIDELLPRADEGLARLGVEVDERERYLGLVRARREALTTGARWLRRALVRLEPGRSRADALERLTLAYLERARTGAPVHTWPEAD